MKNSNSNSKSTFFFVRKLMVYCPFWYAGSAICWIFYHSWPLLLGLLSRAFFNTLQHPGLTGLSLQTIVVLVIAASLALGLVVFAGSLSGVNYRFPVRSLLRRNLVAHILKYRDVKSSGQMLGEKLSTIKDDAEIAGELVDWVFDVFAAALFAGVGIVILLTVDAKVTLLVFIPISLVIFITHLFRLKLSQLRRQSRESTAKVVGLIGELFNSVQTVKLTDVDRNVLKRLDQLNAVRKRFMLRDKLQASSLDAVFENVANLGAGLVLLVAADKMRSGQFTVGDFSLFATYLLQVSRFTGFLGYLINTYRESGVSFTRMVGLLHSDRSSSLVNHSIPGSDIDLASVSKNTQRIERINSLRIFGDTAKLLEVVDLGVHYQGPNSGIKHISFNVPKGSFTVITGRIGSGKTTLLRTLLGLLPAEGGKIFWEGEEVHHPESFLVFPRVGYVPQSPVLMSDSIRNNILLGLKEDEVHLREAIYNSVLERDLAGFPNGLDTQVGIKGMALSGGQIQRTAAARVFVRQPELHVIDDLSTALDVETEKILWNRAKANHDTFIVSSHRQSILRLADHILLLENGELKNSGTLDELLQTSEEMRLLWGENI